jgi:hypothetical protein
MRVLASVPFAAARTLKRLRHDEASAEVAAKPDHIIVSPPPSGTFSA